MDEKNVIFEVTKVGIAVNTKWSVFVDNQYVGKIDFKNNLTKKLSKGNHTVQYKVGLQKTKILDINVADEDIIVECVWDGTVRNFHVIGGENTTTNSNVITNNSNNEDSIFCSKCGTKISSQSVFCSKCGNKINNIYHEEQNQTSKVENNQTKEINTKNTNWLGIIGSIISIVIIVVAFWNIYGGNGVDGEYWFSDGSGYVKINKDINRIYFYDEYNNAKGTTSVKFTGDKTFVYSDGLLEYKGTVNGKKLTVKCENEKIEGYEATKK